VTADSALAIGGGSQPHGDQDIHQSGNMAPIADAVAGEFVTYWASSTPTAR